MPKKQSQKKPRKVQPQVSKALVVVPQKPKKVRIPKSLGVLGSRQQLNSYAAALHAPFDRAALGAKVPDMFSYPVATYHCEGTVTLRSDANGVSSVVITPDPFCTLVDATTASVASTSMYNYVGAYTAYAAVTQTNLSNQLANFRVVGGGIEVRNLMPPTTATGRVITATVPMADVLPGPNALSNTSISNFTLVNKLTSVVPSSGSHVSQGTSGLPSTILQLPGAVHLSSQDLISSNLKVNFKPCSPEAFHFRSTQNDYILGYTGSTAINEAAGANLVSGIPATSYNNLNDSFASKAPLGFDAILLRFEGCTPSTTIADVKYVLHFEGSPTVTNNVASIIADAQASSYVDIAGHQSVLSKVLSMPNIMIGMDALASGISGFAKGGMIGAASNVLSKLGMTF